MIDLHNHLLPALDDGANDMVEALAMARLAVADGITHVVCTPHIRPGVFDNDQAGILEMLHQYRLALADAGIELAVAAAAEVHFGLEVMAMHRADELPLLGEWQGRQVLLLEFPHSGLPVGAERLVDWLIDRDIVPMIAHPERNRDFINSADRLLPFLNRGCLIQVTAGALLGQFGERSQARAEQLLLDGCATCIASDAHNTHNRVPGLARATRAAAAIVGAERARCLTGDNPWKIAQSQFTV